MRAVALLALLIILLCSPVIAVFCPRCGVENADANKFCRNCGLPITEVSRYVGYLEEREREMLKIMGSDQSGAAGASAAAPGLLPARGIEGPSSGYAGKGGDAGPGSSTKAETAEHAASLNQGAVGFASPVNEEVGWNAPAAGGAADRGGEPLPKAKDLLKAGFESMKPAGEGGILIMMTYSAKGGARPFTLPGKVYINSTYLGEILVVEDEKRDDYGFSSDLFGKMSSQSDEVHYKFQKGGIPAGKYQVKVVMQQKGFLKNVSRFKVFGDVTVNPGEEARLFYSWDAKTPFGK